MDFPPTELINPQEEMSFKLRNGFMELIKHAVTNSSLDQAGNEAILDHHLELSQEFATTTADVSLKLGIDLKKDVNFAIWELPKGYDAFVDEDLTVVFNISLLSQIAQLSKRKPELAKARLRKYIAHELKHVADSQRFPTVLEREKDDVRSHPADMTVYHLTRMEQSAELYSAKYLQELDEIDPNQRSANQHVAQKIRRELALNLGKSRIRRNLGKLLSQFSL